MTDTEPTGKGLGEVLLFGRMTKLGYFDSREHLLNYLKGLGIRGEIKISFAGNQEVIRGFNLGSEEDPNLD